MAKQLSNRELVEEHFDGDIKDHTMVVVHDDGVHRHLEFRKNGSSIMMFGIVTWPGHLAYYGDMGSYTFRRLTDMFEFFSGPRINPSYWGEKLEAVDKSSGYRAFSRNVFMDNAMDQWDRFEENGEFEDEAQGERIKQSLIDMVIGAEDDDARAYDAVYDWEEDGFTISDGWEWNNQDFTYRYIWCLKAIVWGIGKYYEL